MLTNIHPADPVPLNAAARFLSVPAKWLRAEVQAGRLPALIADRAILVHVPTVAALLAVRAIGGSGTANDK